MAVAISKKPSIPRQFKPVAVKSYAEAGMLSPDELQKIDALLAGMQTTLRCGNDYICAKNPLSCENR